MCLELVSTSCVSFRLKATRTFIENLFAEREEVRIVILYFWKKDCPSGSMDAKRGPIRSGDLFRGCAFAPEATHG